MARMPQVRRQPRPIATRHGTLPRLRQLCTGGAARLFGMWATSARTLAARDHRRDRFDRTGKRLCLDAPTWRNASGAHRSSGSGGERNACTHYQTHEPCGSACCADAHNERADSSAAHKGADSYIGRAHSHSSSRCNGNAATQRHTDHRAHHNANDGAADDYANRRADDYGHARTISSGAQRNAERCPNNAYSSGPTHHSAQRHYRRYRSISGPRVVGASDRESFLRSYLENLAQLGTRA